jgi:hypothetical protein
VLAAGVRLLILGYLRSVTTDPGSASAPLPRSRHDFHSDRATHAAGILGILLKEAGALDCSDEEIAATIDICRALADLSPRGKAVPTRRLYEYLADRYGQPLLEKRLHALMRAGSVEKDRDVLHEQNVRLTMPGSISLVLVPWITSMRGHHALLELLSRAEERANAPGATADDIRAELAEVRRMLSTYASHVQRIIEDRRTAEMIEYARDCDDQKISSRIGRLNTLVTRSFPRDLADDLERLSMACDWYIRQTQELVKLLNASAATRGYWARADEVHEVLRSATRPRLAAFWDGTAFDEAPVWISPQLVLDAAAKLTFRPEEERVPEAGTYDAASSSVPDPLEDLRALAERLLAGADERDLTEEFLNRPWPFPATILARLTALAGLDAGYALRYPGHLALREEEAGMRVATGVTLRRVPYPTLANSTPEGGN